MLYYYLFGMIMGFIIHFYITFGTNLLTGGLAHIAVLLPVSVFRRKGISNGVQTEWNLRQRDFLKDYDPGDLEFTSEEPRGGQEIGGRPLLGAPPVSWAPRVSSDVNSKSPGSYSSKKSRCRRFHSVWTQFDILRNTETGNKTVIWAGPPISRLVPKVI